MSEGSSNLSRNVRLLGTLLGQTIKDHHGEAFFDRLERIRQLSKAARNDGGHHRGELLEELKTLSDEDLVPVTRAFCHFLNLANLAEQFDGASQRHDGRLSQSDAFADLLARLQKSGFSREQIAESVAKLDMELVLTAHPTEVTRRTLIQKHESIFESLEQLESNVLSETDRCRIENRLSQLITQAWHTNEFRMERPTPVEEAKGGYATVEHSLWYAVPDFLRSVDECLRDATGIGLPLHTAPVRFSSWMGGDRDGNPFVTASVTREVLLLSRWMAADLYLRDLKPLIGELSTTECNDELRQLAGDSPEPYRVVLKSLRTRLKETRDHCEEHIAGSGISTPIMRDSRELIEPLEVCYRSLHETGQGVIADGPLLDMIRRAYSFGLTLIRLDIRQEAARHTQALNELTLTLGMGEYQSWSEPERQAFLLRELQSVRPLLPTNWQPSEPVAEVITTCRAIAAEEPQALGVYVISMAYTPSDVLAVALLLKECGVGHPMPIVPLFETLDALEGAGECIASLFELPWYRGYCCGRQMVMVGYSDSAKDAGWMAAGWAQYRAMESLTELCDRNRIDLTLFHGRGGTIGRGGGPAHSAILSQPPGSVNGHLRVTEQGEMIRFKFGFPDVAVNSLMIYASATLEATLLPPPVPESGWREMMDQLAQDSLQVYRGMVRGEKDFVAYFRTVTPERELARLPLGSRPAKRKADGGVESLRAIPWIFAWSQIRLMLPTWLGCGTALRNALDQKQLPLLREMVERWPFFRARLEMLEMVFMKTDIDLSEYYEKRLVPDTLWGLGETLRGLLHCSIDAVMDLKEGEALMSGHPENRRSIELRNPYTDPLHVLQAELLHRVRQAEERGVDCGELERALMITVAGIAAGMRNTG